ncbi:hypothetical protein F4861DRAFT_102260 [Xylaria intraflava]|nr:hypothetical protein F4861DRAFT_102260 [Xylaria intraflava]
MADEIPEAGSETEPKAIAFEHLDDFAYSLSVMISYVYHGVQFKVLVSSTEDDLPQGYDSELSIEGKFLLEIHELSLGTIDEVDFDKVDEVKDRLMDLVSATCLPFFLEMAPPKPLPEPRTMEEQLYPPTHKLQVLTEGDKLVFHKISDSRGPERPVPLSEEQLRELALDAEIPVYHPSKVVLIKRLQSLVWQVNVDGEIMICKVAMHPIFGPTLANELGAYQKIGRFGDELKLPKLKGVVKSHTGIIAVLLSYIPHKYHSLTMILDYVKEGLLPKTEATTAMRTKWAGQIKHAVERLNELGILWLDTKTDNVLIDDEGDAIVLDFGGGNTVGWVDHDKYGTLEGVQMGLDKIMAALKEE